MYNFLIYFVYEFEDFKINNQSLNEKQTIFKLEIRKYSMLVNSYFE